MAVAEVVGGPYIGNRGWHWHEKNFKNILQFYVFFFSRKINKIYLKFKIITKKF